MEQVIDPRVKLPATFRYLHAPAGPDLPSAAVGREDATHAFAERLIFSNGGALLVTGFRGVGKTTFVQGAIAEIQAHRRRYEDVLGPFRLVDVWINLAKPVTAAQLMHLLIRQLYVRLDSLKLLDDLDPTLRHDLHKSFMRTCFEISARSVATEERGRDMSIGFDKAPLLGLEFLAKLGTTAKRTRSDEDLLKYLPYDEKAAETDLLDFSRRLARPSSSPALSWVDRWWNGLRGITHETPARMKVVFVLDELDKLERFTGADNGKSSPLDPLFEALKTVFTGSEFSYVFIAGKEAHERWARDVALGDSIYESIFGYDVYLPCLWTDQRGVIDVCLFGNGSRQQSEDEELAIFRQYLCYQGRGIPRRIVRELNRHVRWDDGRPVLAFTPEQRRSMAVFAKVQDLLEDLTDILDAPTARPDTPADDRRRLALYYTLDWVLRRGSHSFAFAELYTAAQELNLGGGSERMTREVIDRIVGLLVKRGLLTRLSRTIVETDRAAAEAAAEYRVAAWVLRALQPVLEAPADAAFPPNKTVGADIPHLGRYRVLNRVGQGGMATVYRVLAPSGETRAAKLLRWESDETSPEMLARFQREIAILERLDHPSIVRVHEHGVEGSNPYFVMDYIEGSSLHTLLARMKRLAPSAAAFIGARLADVYAYVHDSGVVRNDIKPSNIMVDGDGRLVVIDFGISHLEGASSLTRTQAFIGTPRYMSPEQIKGAPVDHRSDVFSLGALVYEMVTGTAAFQGAGLHEELVKVLSDMPPPPSTLAPSVTPELDAIILKALAKDAEERFATMTGFAAALAPFAREVNLASLAQRFEANATAAAHQNTVAFSPGKYPTPFAPAPMSPQPSASPTPAVARPAPAAVIAKRPQFSAPVSADQVELLVDLEKQLLVTSWEPDRVVSLAKGQAIVGRSLAADIVIDRPTLSRDHAMLALADGRLVIEDLGSAGGVVIDEKRVRQAPLSHGDVVKLGDLRVRVLFGPI